MKRDPRLHGLSSDHHHALVLARTVRELDASGRAGAADARDVEATFAREIEPHFRVEEDVLLPALREIGELELVRRTEADHAFLRSAAAAAGGGDLTVLASFAERLVDHVRFEENELFACCEAKLPPAVLDEVARRAPKGR